MRRFTGAASAPILAGLVRSGDEIQVEGASLAARLGAGPLSVRETLALGLAVAGALEEAHALGVVHGHLGADTLRLAGGDVERAEIVGLGDEPPRGARATMAPEQARGAEASARADVFALGAVLHQCLTGAPAFAADDPTALLAKIVLDDVPRAGARLSWVPVALEDLLGRMLDKDPARRPRDGGGGWRRSSGGSRRVRGRPGRARRRRGRSWGPASGAWWAWCWWAAGGGAGDLPAPLEVVQAAVLARHGRLSALADGSLAVVLPGAGSAEDRAAITAGCATALRTLLPARPMAMAVGRTEAVDGRPVGEAIDRAARLLRALGRLPGGSRASAGIAVDDAAAVLLERSFDLGEGPAWRELRGARPPLESPRTLLGRATPCVGRGRELSALAAIFEQSTSEPRARAALVTAPAGFGKSRLAQELLDRVRGQGQLWIGRGDPSSAGSAFSVLAAALKHTAGVFDGDPLPLRREKLRARVTPPPGGRARRARCRLPGRARGRALPRRGRARSRRRAPRSRCSWATRCAGPGSPSSAPSAPGPASSWCSTICTGATSPPSSSSTPRWRRCRAGR